MTHFHRKKKSWLVLWCVLELERLRLIIVCRNVRLHTHVCTCTQLHIYKQRAGCPRARPHQWPPTQIWWRYDSWRESNSYKGNQNIETWKKAQCLQKKHTEFWGKCINRSRRVGSLVYNERTCYWYTQRVEVTFYTSEFNMTLMFFIVTSVYILLIIEIQLVK